MTAAQPVSGMESTADLIENWVLWQRTPAASRSAPSPNAPPSSPDFPTPSTSPPPVSTGSCSAATRSTRATHHQAIRAWCRWLITTGRRTDDTTILAPPPKVPRGRPRPLAAAHLGVLLQSVNRRRTCAMILLAAYAGIRVSEIAAVRGEDVDLLTRTITVVGKGDKQRTILCTRT